MNHSDVFRPICRNVAAIGAAAVFGFATVALADGGANHQTLQPRPSQLGVSGSSIEFLVNKNRAFCYTGTLGSLVEGDIDGDGVVERFILSNNHVLAKENNPDSPDLAADGYDIIQPGLLDEGSCTLSRGDPANVLATLTDWVDIQFGKGKNPPVNNVDAAIAEVMPGQVDSLGTILDIGTVSGATLPATIGLQVQKSGRTTGHTFGTVEAVNVDIDVKYNSGTARFVDQIRIRGVCGTEFSAGGDSGSVIANVPGDQDRQAVGLLFAGGDLDTFANSIDTVLADMGSAAGLSLSMVDGGLSAQVQNDTANVAECTEEPEEPSGPPGRGGRPSRGASDPLGLEIAADVKDRHSNELFALPGVAGHGIGVDADGEAVIEVYVENASQREVGRPIPNDIEGIPVRIVSTGAIRAF